jgi:pimeloyl-ACP methyl ester carboxylesterase
MGDRMARGTVRRALIVTACASLIGATVPAAADDTDQHQQRQQKHDEADTGFTTTQSGSMVTPWSGEQADLDEIANALMGDNAIVVEDVNFIGDRRAIGTYDGLPTGTSRTATGVILSTGLVTDADTVSFASTNLGRPGDARLSEISGGTTYDAAVLEFRFVAPSPRAIFDFQFASEEWPNWVGSGFNDAFALDINGVNCAETTDGSTVTVNEASFHSSPSGLSYNGITDVYTCSETINPFPQWNTARFAIADTGDAIYDSAVHLGGDSFRGGQAADVDPLLLVHGWTDSAAGWNEAIALLRETTGINPVTDDRVHAVTTLDPFGYILTNALRLIHAAENHAELNGTQKVNVIGHSKGGLDTRLASSVRPDLFGTLYMLGTPNAGSIGANIACLPGPFGVPGTNKKSAGFCARGGDNAGLDDLRLGSMLEFNRTVAPPATVDYFTLGGDAGGIAGTALGLCSDEEHIVSMRANSLWDRTFGTTEWWAYATQPAYAWDVPVCLRSLFSLSVQERDPGRWSFLRPSGPAHFYRHVPRGYYKDMGHKAVYQDPCAVLPAFAQVLPAGMIGEPTDPGRVERNCPEYRHPYTSNDTASVSILSTTDINDTTPTTAVYTRQSYDLTDGTVTLELPHSDQLVAIDIAHDADSIELVDSQNNIADHTTVELGRELSTTTFDARQLEGDTATLTTTGGNRADVIIRVTAQPDEPELDVQTDGDQVTVAITTSDDTDAAGTLWVIGEDDMIIDSHPLGGDHADSVTFTLPGGSTADIHTQVTEPHHRHLQADVATTDPNVASGPVTARDAIANRIEFTLPLEASRASDYIATVEITDQHGDLVTTATALPSLDSPTGQATFVLDRQQIQVALVENRGPLTIENLTLVRTEGGFVRIGNDPGPFGTLDTDDAGDPTSPLLGTIDYTVTDELTFNIPVIAAPEDAGLWVEARLLGPDGSTVETYSTPVDGDTVNMVATAEQLENAGTGHYHLTDIRLVTATGSTLHRTGMVTAIVTGDTTIEHCAPLLADQDTDIGEVCATWDGTEVDVTYTTIPGWLIDTSHVAAGESRDDYHDNGWVTRNGNPRPGQFPHHGQPGGTTTYHAALTVGDDLEKLIVAAHADVTNTTSGTTSGAWADGDRFVERGNWATYMTLEP